jgi:hypothetical protein
MRFLACLAVATLILGWMLFSPFTLGNDYQAFQVQYGMIPRFYELQGIFPMWYPHLEGGVPIGIFTMGQSFHLPAWIISRIPGYWSGNIVRLMTWKHAFAFLLGLLLSFHFLKKTCTRLPAWIALACCTTLIFNLRSLDAMRYGTYIDAAMFMHMLVLSFMLFLRWPRYWGFLALIAETQLLMTAGYDTMIAFAALALAFGWVCTWIYTDIGMRLLVRRSIYALIAGLLGCGLAAPHWMPFFEALKINFTRFQHPDIYWASNMALDFYSLGANLYAPWLAEVHSGFGGAALLSALLLGGLIYLSSSFKKNWLLLAGLLFPVLYALGARGPVFGFFFHHVPGFSSFRIPGRILSILPSVTLIIMACAYPQVDQRPNQLQRLLASLKAGLALLAIGTLFVFVWVHQYGIPQPDGYTPVGINAALWTKKIQRDWLVCTFFSIGLSWLMLRTHPFRRFDRTLRYSFAAALAVSCLLQTFYVFRYGSWTVPLQAKPSLEQLESTEHLPLLSHDPLISVPRIAPSSYGVETANMVNFTWFTGAATPCFYPFDPYFPSKVPPPLQSAILPWIVTDQVLCVSNFMMTRAWTSDEVCDAPHFVTQTGSSPLCNSISEIPPSNARSFRRLIDLNKETKLVSLTPNLIELELSLPRAAVLGTSFPNVPNWHASIDGIDSRIQDTDGGLVGVSVPQGHHRVAIYYYTEIYWKAYLTALLSAVVLILISFEYRLFARRRSTWPYFSHRSIFYGITLMLTAVIAQPILRDTIQEKALKHVLLNNDYDRFLNQQLSLWKSRIGESEQDLE